MARNLFLRNETWVFRKEIDGRDWRVSTGFSDRKAAERRAKELEVEIRKRGLGWTPAPSTAFGQWAKAYCRSYTVRKRAGRRDLQILAHVEPAWSNRPLETITRSECVAYMARREGQGMSPGTIRREVGLLKAMFNAAINEGLLTQNPWRGIKLPRTEPRRRVLSTTEQAALFNALNEDYRRLVTVALGTGLRVAELLGLAPRQVDQAAKRIRVSPVTAKGGKGRTVPLLPTVAQAIERQMATRQCEPDDRLWPQTGSAVYKTLRAAAKRAKIEPLSVHDLRRTFGTRCAVNGMPVPQLQKIMGHHAPEVTMTHYVHVQEDDLGRALARVEAHLVPPEAGTRVVTFEKRAS